MLCKSLIAFILIWLPFVSMTQQKFVHQQQLLENAGKAPNSNYYSTKNKASAYLLKKVPSSKYTHEVFGWYPKWDKKYYKIMNYDLLSTVAYFNYNVNPNTGGVTGFYNWPTTPLVDSVQAHGKNILLTATNFGGADNHTLLANSTARNKLINNLVAANAQRQGNGICIDFEGINGEDNYLFASFIKSLKDALVNQNNRNKVYITLPSVDWNKAFLFDSLISSVDRFVVMGYDYYSSSSSTTGPNSPINSGSIWAANNLTNSVNYYLNNKIPAGKLILGMPFFGLEWETATNTIGAKPNAFIASPGYASILDLGMTQGVESASQSTYSIVSDGSSQKSYKQYWYEADSSFEVKLNYIKSKKLAGLGIWALGYESPYPDLWLTISNAFSTGNISAQIFKFPKDSIPSDSIVKHFFTAKDSAEVAKIMQLLENKLNPIIKYKSILLITISWLALFGALGLLLGVFYPDTRIYFFSTAAIRNSIIVFVLVCLLIILTMNDILKANSITFIIGFALGAFIFYLINKKVQNRKKNLP